MTADSLAVKEQAEKEMALNPPFATRYWLECCLALVERLEQAGEVIQDAQTIADWSWDIGTVAACYAVEAEEDLAALRESVAALAIPREEPSE